MFIHRQHTDPDAEKRLTDWILAFEDLAANSEVVVPGYDDEGRPAYFVDWFNGNGRNGFGNHLAAARYAIRQGHIERLLGTGQQAEGLPKMLALKDLHHYRNGGISPTGNPAEIDTPKTGRCRCRCCGERIAKGDTALMIPMRWADNNSAYHTEAVWVHLDCDPIRVKRVEQANY